MGLDTVAWRFNSVGGASRHRPVTHLAQEAPFYGFTIPPHHPLEKKRVPYFPREKIAEFKHRGDQIGLQIPISGPISM